MARSSTTSKSNAPNSDSRFSPQYDREKDRRQIYFLLGLCLSLSFTLLAFQWNGSINTGREYKDPKPEKESDIEYTLIHSEKKIQKEQPIAEAAEIKNEPISNEIKIVKTVNKKTKSKFADPTEFLKHLPEPTPEVIPPDPPKPRDPVKFYTKAPEFPGGLKQFNKYLKKKVHYTDWAIDMRAEGMVYVSFVVNLDGSITDINIERGLVKDLDDQIINALENSPDWVPGMQGKQTVRVRYTIPFRFELP